MTTTGHFQANPDWYPDAKSCQEAIPHNTNPRYKMYTQTHFTAGDFQQFQEYRDQTNGLLSTDALASEALVEADSLESEASGVIIPSFSWEKYENLHPLAVDNTFHYLFEKFKKGIFIKIKNGKLGTFLPFSNKNYTNEWETRIKIDPKYGDLFGFIKHIQTISGYRYNPQKVNKFLDTWYANNCLVRHEFPIYEGDTNVPNTSDMFLTLANERTIPDVEFFVNRRDYPMLKRNGTEAYSDIFDSDTKPLLSHNYDKYAPILSMVTTSEYADIPIPTGDDWAMVTREEGKYFPKSEKRSFEMKGSITKSGWKKRKNTAVFRGSSTGRGVTVETNQRLKLAWLSYQESFTDPEEPLLDAGITEWNTRPRKLKGEKYLQTIDPSSFPFTLVAPLTPQEQTEYKYIVNVEGHVASYRLSLELKSGSCILLASSEYKLWYSHLLEPWTHYVPVKHDLSDLYERIEWCRENDEKCLQIAKNAKKFGDKYITREGILNYLQLLLFRMKEYNGSYHYNAIPLSVLLKKEERKLISSLDNDEKEVKASSLPFQRCYGVLKGMAPFVPNQDSDEVLFENKSTRIVKYSFLGTDIVKKTNNDLEHEAFISFFGTNKLCKSIPNFVYAYKYASQDSSLLLEYVKGQTLNEYIKSREFSFQDYFLILIQIGLALSIAQKECSFVHNDLFPWNIILKKETKTIEYEVDEGVVYRVESKMVPVIIDFEVSHIVYKACHYGKVNPFKSSTVQDILSLLLTSVYEITNFDLTKQEVSHIVILANFLSGTRYRRKPFRATGKNGLGDVRYFFHKEKKFSHLLTSEKYDLENKTPLDFVEYILKNINLSFPVERVEKMKSRYVIYPSLVSSLIEGDDPKKALSDAISGLGECRFDLDFLNSLTPILREYKIPYLKKLQKLKKTADAEEADAEEAVSKNTPSVPKISYSEETFLFPEKLLKIIEESVPGDSFADHYTLRYLARKMAKKNLKFFPDEEVYENIILACKRKEEEC